MCSQCNFFKTNSFEMRFTSKRARPWGQGRPTADKPGFFEKGGFDPKPCPLCKLPVRIFDCLFVCDLYVQVLESVQ